MSLKDIFTEINPRAALVYLFLLANADEQGIVTMPVRKIANALGITNSTVFRAIEQLKMFQKCSKLSSNKKYSRGLIVYGSIIYEDKSSSKLSSKNIPNKENKEPLPPTPPIKEIKENERIINAQAQENPTPSAQPSKSPEKKKIFHRPTPEEVDAYILERGYQGFTGQSFCDFYTSKGWVVGKSPMKDWRAAVRTWEQKRKRYATENTSKYRNLSPEERERQYLAESAENIRLRNEQG